MAETKRTEHDTIDEELEDYDENADEDFNPNQAACEEQGSSPSEDDEDAAKAPKKPKKRKSDAIEELDSGDDVTIKERRRRKRKVAEEDSGDEGGLIKTRAQRFAEYATNTRTYGDTD